MIVYLKLHISRFFSLGKLESKESLVSNGLDNLEPGIHQDEVQEMSNILDSLSQKCDELQQGQKDIPSLSHTNQRRLHLLAGRLASLRVVVDRRVAETPSRVVRRHPSDAFLSEVMPAGWERSFTEDDIPYYVNHPKEVKLPFSFSVNFTSICCCKNAHKECHMTHDLLYLLIYFSL